MSTAAALLRRAGVKASRSVVRWSTRTTPRGDLVRLGSEYGGWWVPADLIGRDSTCYLAGVGEDVTFDLALVDRFGCEVWAIDPTPRAIEHVATITEPRFHLLPIGLWGSDTTLGFHAPADPTHVSHSATNMQRTAVSFEAECRTVRSVMADRGHVRLDLLKLDIEGAEVPVLEDLLAHGPLPRVLCVELDAPEAPHRTWGRLRRLRAAGYVCRRVEGRNYTFTREQDAASS
ncbi:methyltransferase, FkbM family [Nocardioides scoriae]|uniref:Methyltransferase, FkbM family n=1 Tax=Nocardioides scoriae TaxID=642780 RepID=A0A1H1WVY4_9ACTN|nr:FkbM family methyltransferase [Nocardioides scoriae]SDT01162.1 methyltransferase, FkbM family [Nocardioides scoriae]